MDVLVLIEERFAAPAAPPATPPPGPALARTVPAAPAVPLAHVHAVPATGPHEAGAREVVTLYGDADARILALALAAALEGERTTPADVAPAGVMRHLGVFEDGGAVGDLAWRDRRTGQLLTRDLEIPAATLQRTADRLLAECGALIRGTAAGLAMPDWPEGVRRAIHLAVPALAPADAPGNASPGGTGHDARLASLLASLREADGDTYATAVDGD